MPLNPKRGGVFVHSAMGFTGTVIHIRISVERSVFSMGENYYEQAMKVILGKLLWPSL